MGTMPAIRKGVGLLLILLLTVFFATAAANPAFGHVQLPFVNLGEALVTTGPTYVVGSLPAPTLNALTPKAS